MRAIGAGAAIDSIGLDLPGSAFGDANGNIFTAFAGFPMLSAGPEDQAGWPISLGYSGRPSVAGRVG